MKADAIRTATLLPEQFDGLVQAMSAYGRAKRQAKAAEQAYAQQVRQQAYQQTYQQQTYQPQPFGGQNPYGMPGAPGGYR